MAPCQVVSVVSDFPEGVNYEGMTHGELVIELYKSDTEVKRLSAYLDSNQAMAAETALKLARVIRERDTASAEYAALEKRHTEAVDAWNREIDRNKDLVSTPPSTEFSTFIREGSPEGKERVFSKVIDDANAAQSERECDACGHLRGFGIVHCKVCGNASI